MVNEKRLIDANVVLSKQFTAGLSDASGNYYGHADVIFADDIANAHTVDAVEVYRIEEVKQAILQTFDNLIAIHRDISNSQFANSAQYLNIPESSNDYNGIYADAMEVARRFVNAALTDLCDKNGRGNDNG